MRVLSFGISLYVIAFILHLIIWRIRIPKRQTKALLLLFFSILLAGLFCLWEGIPFFSFTSLFENNNIAEYVHISLLFISLTFGYIITYSALEADSPSILIVLAISKTGSNGLDKNEFDKLMNDDLLITPRIKDLLRDKMAYIDGDKYVLTTKGALFAKIFIFYRRLLKAQKGG